MSASEADIDAFGRFAKQQLHVSTGLSLQQLLAKWEADREANAVADDIEQGLKDIDAGKGRPVADAFQSVRGKLGLGE